MRRMACRLIDLAPTGQDLRRANLCRSASPGLREQTGAQRVPTMTGSNFQPFLLQLSSAFLVELLEWPLSSTCLLARTACRKRPSSWELLRCSGVLVRACSNPCRFSATCSARASSTCAMHLDARRHRRRAAGLMPQRSLDGSRASIPPPKLVPARIDSAMLRFRCWVLSAFPPSIV